MRLQSLNHLIEVVRAVARPTKVLVLGSSSLLPTHPDLGGAGQPLELTTDADLLLSRSILEPQRLRQHYQRAPLGERETLAAGRNLQVLLKDLGQS